MQTKEQIEQAFRAELQTLLDKYGAELEAKDHYQGYAECGEDVCMTVNIPGIWDKDGETVREWTEIDLGSHLWPTPNALSSAAAVGGRLRRNVRPLRLMRLRESNGRLNGCASLRTIFPTR